MPDPDQKIPSIPQWQLSQNGTTQSQPPGNTPSNLDSPLPDAERSAVLGQASKFLEDESIRDAPIDRKISFLESKGLTQDEIQSILRAAQNTEATSNTTAENPDSAVSRIKTTREDRSSPSPSVQIPEQHLVTASSLSASQPPASSPPQSLFRSESPRDVPPIITYPEFLLKEPEKPPLVTASGVIYTLYGAAGLCASIYGAAEYFVKPLFANLTGARHDFAETTIGNLKELNEKLENNISTVPPYSPSTGVINADSEDTESITSDPTELFHRDIGTQTSQDTSVFSDTASTENDTRSPTATVSKHVESLESIRTLLRGFAEQDKSSEADDTVRLRLSELQHYLDGLMHSKAAYSISSYSLYTSNVDKKSNGMVQGEDDAISAFRSEIRGVKGALLSAKNFPATRGARISSSIPLSR